MHTLLMQKITALSPYATSQEAWEVEGTKQNMEDFFGWNVHKCNICERSSTRIWTTHLQCYAVCGTEKGMQGQLNWPIITIQLGQSMALSPTNCT